MTKALKLLRGTIEEHYAKLGSCILKLKRVDPEGRFELYLDEGAFSRVYTLGSVG